MASILPFHGICVNSRTIIFYSSRDEQKPLSVFENLFPFTRNPSRKTTDQTGEKEHFLFFGRVVLEW
jgi:hypothetical protein